VSWKLRPFAKDAIIVEVTEDHFHNYERWFGAQPAQIGPGSLTSLTPFRVTSLNVAETFGASIVVFDGTETPVQTGMVKFDFHRIMIIDAQNTNKTYRLRFANSSKGHITYNDAVAAGVYTDLCFRLTTNASQPQPVTMVHRRVPSGTKVWAAVATLDGVAQWLDFLVGIHEYDI
jgi:hypothetical protein